MPAQSTFGVAFAGASLTTIVRVVEGDVAQHGDIRRSDEIYCEALELATRLGHGPTLRYLPAELATNAYFLGDWELLLATAARYEAGARERDYLLQGLLTDRAVVRLARGPLDDACGRPPGCCRGSRGAAQLLARGRRADAEQQLARALDFWRSVGATHFIREEEALRAEAATA